MNSDDRQYDREIVQLEAIRRMQGKESDFPVFAMPLDHATSADVLTDREKLGHPGTWDGTPDIAPLPEGGHDEEGLLSDLAAVEEDGGTLCSRRLHLMTADNTRPNRGCKMCRAVNQKRDRSAKAGKPLCWAAKHSAPEWGELCPCGNEPPEDTFIDWAVVEDVLAGRDVLRHLTNAEQLCAYVTTVLRFPRETASSWLLENTKLRLSTDRIKYLTGTWAPANGIQPVSAADVFLADMQTADQEESQSAA